MERIKHSKRKEHGREGHDVGVGSEERVGDEVRVIKDEGVWDDKREGNEVLVRQDVGVRSNETVRDELRLAGVVRVGDVEISDIRNALFVSSFLSLHPLFPLFYSCFIFLSLLVINLVKLVAD